MRIISAAVCQPLAMTPPSDAFLGGFFVDVVGERHEALAEVEDLLFVDGDGAELMHGTRNSLQKSDCRGKWKKMNCS